MNNFWSYENVTQMHIELTNGCNAGCPMCVRFYQMSPLVRPDMKIGQITLNDFKKFFPPEFIKQLTTILFCGVSGDAGTARDTLQICEYIASCNSTVTVRMNTNGGMRKPDWWEKMGKLFLQQKKYNWGMTFSIDGLEDTNHLYRRNVQWPVLIKNLKAFVSTGAITMWDYLIFEHNEHQIDEARELAESLNIHFRPKRALGVDDGEYLRPMHVRNELGEIDYYIRAPKNPDNRNLSNPKGTRPDDYQCNPNFDPQVYWDIKRGNTVERSNNGVGDLESRKPQNAITFEENRDTIYSSIEKMDTTKEDNTEIQCKSKMNDGGTEIFVDQAGRVMPCCYIGTHLNSKFFAPATAQLHHQMKKYNGFEVFNLHNYTLKEILELGNLNRVWADAWSKKKATEGKMLFCSRTCPKNTLSPVDKIFRHKDDSIKADHQWANQFKKEGIND